MTRYTTCGKCSHYSYKLGRCRDGKVNPRTLKGTVAAMKIMGINYICRYSRWKQKAVDKLLGGAQ